MADKKSKAQKNKSNASTLTLIRKKPGLDFSVTGLVYCGMMLFMGLAAVNSQANLLFGVFGLMVGILLVSGVISRLVLKRMQIRRVLPPHGVVGRQMAVTYEFVNTKRIWPSLSVSLAELDGAPAFTKQPQCYLLHVAAKMTATVPAEYIPRRRGLHTLDRYQISTSFPFGFVKRATSGHHKDSVLVYPPAATVDARLLHLCKSAENSGERMRPSPGGNDEFYGVSEFRTGDNPRHVYWRRSARTGVLVMRQMTRVSPPRLLVVVDTYATSRSIAEHIRIERAIAMAGSLVARAMDDGLAVGLYAWSGDWLGLHPEQGKRHRDDILSVLSRLPLNTEHTSQELLENVSTFTRSGTSLVVFTPHEMNIGMNGRGRGSTILVSTATAQADTWFKFASDIDWATCMPLDQQPPLTASKKAKSKSKNSATTANPA